MDKSVYLAAGDVAGIDRLVQYMARCPFSLARMIKVTPQGKVLYKAGKATCRRFPETASEDLFGGISRNFQVFEPLDFLAELPQHIPDKGEHLIRYYGWYSNKKRGMRAKAAAGSTADGQGLPNRAADPELRPAVDQSTPDRKEARRRWAALIKRVYEVDPLRCPRCGGQMKVISFIEARQEDVIAKILKHCGVWEQASGGPPKPTADSAAPDHRPAPVECQMELDPDFIEQLRLEQLEFEFVGP